MYQSEYMSHKYRSVKHCTAIHYETTQSGDNFVISQSFIDFAGFEVGIHETARRIPQFSGSKRIQDLDLVPVSYVTDFASMSGALVERGRKFHKMLEPNLHQYSGPAIGIVKDHKKSSPCDYIARVRALVLYHCTAVYS